MTKFIHRPARALALLLAAILVAALTACGGGGSHDTGYNLPGYGPTYAGHASCGYIVDRSECADSGVPSAYWYPMPSTQPVGYRSGYDTNNILWMMFFWHLMYHSYYGSPGYYNHYVPTRYRSSYTSRYVTPFNRTYSSQERTASKQATYKTSKGKIVPASKVPVKKLNPAKLNPPKNNGGNNGGCNKFAQINVGGGNAAPQVNAGSIVQLSSGHGGSGSGSHGGGSHGGGGSKPKPPKPNSGGGSKKGTTNKGSTNKNNGRGGSGC